MTVNDVAGILLSTVTRFVFYISKTTCVLDSDYM